MESCSVGSVLNSKCRAGKNNSYLKIDVDELPFGQVELKRIHSKTEPFTDVIDCVQDTSLLITFQVHIDTKVLMSSWCTKLLLKQIYRKYY